MEGCLFCAIAAGQVKAQVVHETPDAVAFLDAHPAARGHVLVVPRAHAPTILDLDDGAIAGLFRTVKEVVRKVRDGLAPSGMHVGWNHGRSAGQRVFHLHVHVLPRQGNGRGVQALGEGAAGVDLAEVAERIRRA